MKTVAQIKVVPSETVLNGKVISHGSISDLYREFAGDYPKFHKMDMLSKLGFMAAEILLKDFTAEEKENMAVVLFNRNGSLITDRNYQATISDGNFFPSPALFVYTLANIVTGEIAIRHKIFGETSFYILSKKDETKMEEIISSIFLTASPSFVLAGWVDYDNPEDYLAELKLITQ